MGGALKWNLLGSNTEARCPVEVSNNCYTFFNQLHVKKGQCGRSMVYKIILHKPDKSWAISPSTDIVLSFIFVDVAHELYVENI